MTGNFSGLRAIALLGVSALAVAGCSSSSTFDDNGPSFEQQILGSTLGVIGLSDPNAQRKKNIDYSARAGLVVPPTTEALPAPAEKVSSAKDPEWPVEPEERRAAMRAFAEESERNRRNADENARIDPADQVVIVNTPERAERQEVYDGDGPQSRRASSYKRPDRKLWKRNKKELEPVALGDDGLPTRTYLTDPPKELMVPSENAEYALPTKKKKRRRTVTDLDIERGRDPNEK